VDGGHTPNHGAARIGLIPRQKTFYLRVAVKWMHGGIEHPANITPQGRNPKLPPRV
jgi:hypothetical protein